jgi:hypothetical protein
VVRLRLLIETVLQKLFAVKLNLMSANLGVVFMRRPNRPHREPNEYDYQNYIWKDLAQRILKKDEHTAGDTTVDELAVRLESEFDKQRSGWRALMQSCQNLMEWTCLTMANLP